VHVVRIPYFVSREDQRSSARIWGKQLRIVKIAVGSTNPIKIDAVRAVAGKIFTDATVEGMTVDSGVRRNPLTDAETIAGAVRRATEAREKAGADLGVGIEGGITAIEGRHYTCVWCAVDDGRGVTTGGGVHIPVPDAVLRAILKGAEMGEVMDALTSIKDTKRKMGFEGIVTGGLIDRRDSFEAVVTYTLARFINPGLYP